MWTGDSGNCSDGLGDSEIDPTNNISTAGPNQGVSSGNHYYVISNPGTSYPITVSPTAFGYGSSSGPDEDSLRKGESTPPFVSDGKGTPIQPPYPRGRVNASVSFSVSTWTPSLELTSITTGPDGSWNVQIGTPETAFLIWTDMNGNTLQQLPSPLSCVDYDWVVPGTTFASWNTSLSSGTLIPVTWVVASSQSFTWADGSGSCKSGGVQVEPSVACTIENNGTSIGDEQAQAQVEVWCPYIDWVSQTVGDPAYTFPGPSKIASGSGSVAGCNMTCNVGVSSVFGSAVVSGKTVGMGNINCCQLVDMDDIAWYGVLKIEDNTSNFYLLDAGAGDEDWYYNQSSGSPNNQNCAVDQNWPSINPWCSFYDTPGWTLTDVGMYATSWSVNYDFENTAMFQPVGGVWVPLLYATWNWQDSGTNPYTNPPGRPPEISVAGAPTDVFPQWSGYHSS